MVWAQQNLGGKIWGTLPPNALHHYGPAKN